MREVVGFLALHLALICVGLCAMSALGLIDSPISARWRWLWALGPAMLTGFVLVVPCLIVGLVLGIGLSLLTTVVIMVGWVLISVGVRALRRRRPQESAGNRSRAIDAGPAAASGEAGVAGHRVFPASWVRGTLVVAVIYAVAGAIALARSPTGGDDARIWSLRGLTLAYYGSLRPEIFLNPSESGAHPVYPLFAPVVEALLSKAMGHPQLRLYHTELWLLFCATVWTAGYLVARRIGRETPNVALLSLAPLAALAVVPFAVGNIVTGYVDVTASTLLAVGTLAFGLWIESGEGENLAMSALLLGAAASTKDEDLLAALCVLVLGALAVLIRPRTSGLSGRPAARRRLLGLLGAGAYFLASVGPWRAWTAHHHFSDGVEPKLPQALSPGFLAGRGHELRMSAAAIFTQIAHNWDWVGAVFLVACVACLATRTARRTAAFYLASFVLTALAILWLYTTTPISLSFLIPTSLTRTIGVFMTLAAVATAHLLLVLLDPLRPTSEPAPSSAVPSPEPAGCRTPP